jgi:hypothetical protein
MWARPAVMAFRLERARSSSLLLPLHAQEDRRGDRALGVSWGCERLEGARIRNLPPLACHYPDSLVPETRTSLRHRPRGHGITSSPVSRMRARSTNSTKGPSAPPYSSRSRWFTALASAASPREAWMRAIRSSTAGVQGLRNAW